MYRGITFIFLILCISISNAQTHRFIYEYKFIPDSTKTDNLITENTRLEIFNDHSEFLSELIAKKDSANFSNKKQSNHNIANLPEGKFKNKVYKSENYVYTLEYIGIQPFKVIQNEKIIWKLINENKQINGYNCQKAITKYGKRIWEAWFTQEIPIQNGPYVFGNLPGLIIELSDTKMQHHFLLVENYKTTNEESNFKDSPYLPSSTVNPLQFNSKWKIYAKNPLGGMEQFMILNPGLLTGESFDKDGNKIDNQKRLIEERNYAKKELNENNNYINLELYQ